MRARELARAGLGGRRRSDATGSMARARQKANRPVALAPVSLRAWDRVSVEDFDSTCRLSGVRQQAFDGAWLTDADAVLATAFVRAAGRPSAAAPHRQGKVEAWAERLVTCDRRPCAF